MAPKASKHKASNGYALPDKIPPGTILTTVTKKQFRVGKSIGVGGFGEIYLCSDDVSQPVGDDAATAVKIEPHSNGPLFVEMNFYIRAAAPEAVEEFMQNKGISSLGMPCYRGCGSHIFKGDKFRFLVMDRFGNDLQKIFQSGKKLFSSQVSFNLALKILDVLEYIHSKGYVHNDIKAQNLLLGHGRTKENDVYLVDFGLVSKFHRGGVHLEYKPDARKAHDGTIEYTSRDAHIGAHSRRSDLEILGYNLVHWMSGQLPWMDNLTNVEYVEAQKKGFMNDIKAFLQACFGDVEYPGVLFDYLTYTNSLEFDAVPDYDRCRAMFHDALIAGKHPLDGKLDFTTKRPVVKKSQKKKKRHVSGLDEVDAKRSLHRGQNGHHPTPSASPSPDINDFGALTRSSGNSEGMDNWSWERVLCSDPEMLIRQASRHSEADDESPLALQHRALEERQQAESLRNPTPVMLEVLQRMEDRERERESMSWQQQLQHLTGRKLAPRVSSWDLTPNPLTPAMEEVIRMRSKRISVEIDIPITPEPSDSEESDDDTSSHEEYIPPSATKKKLSPLPHAAVGANQPQLHQDVAPHRRRLIGLQDDDTARKSNGYSLDLPSLDEDPEVSVGAHSRLGHKSRAAWTSTSATATTATGSRRGSLPHVLKVTNLVTSPDRIRNKGSPIKVSPKSSEPESLHTTGNNKRRKSGSTPKGLKRKLVDETPLDDSLPAPTTAKRAKLGSTGKRGRASSGAKASNPTRLRNGPQGLSSIPVDVSIESFSKVSTAKVVKAKKKNSGKKNGRRKFYPVEDMHLEDNNNDLDGEEGEEEPLPVSRKRVSVDYDSAETFVGSNRHGRSTRSSEGRTTRSKDWSWEKILLTHPEKIVKKK